MVRVTYILTFSGSKLPLVNVEVNSFEPAQIGAELKERWKQGYSRVEYRILQDLTYKSTALDVNLVNANDL